MCISAGSSALSGSESVSSALSGDRDCFITRLSSSSNLTSVPNEALLATVMVALPISHCPSHQRTASTIPSGLT
jgi:hypothetical protein